MFCSPSAQDVCLTLRGSNSSYSMSRLAPTFTYIPVQCLWPQGSHRRWYPCSRVVWWARIQCICPWALFLKLCFSSKKQCQRLLGGQIPVLRFLPLPMLCACRSWCWTRRYACGRSCCRNSNDGWQELVVGWAEIPPLVSRFRCQTRQCIRQVQCVQEDMLCLQDFHVEDRYSETLQKPSMLQERWQRHWWEGLNWKYAKRAKMRTAKSVIINLLSLWTPEYDHVYYIYIFFVFCCFALGKMTKAQHA